MNRIIVQIYEVQEPTEAEKLVESGVDHIGSVVVTEKAWKIPLIRETIRTVDQTEAKSSLIPLFNTMDTVFRTLDYYRPDIVHFCETLTQYRSILKDCEALINLQENVKNRFPEIKIMRSIPISVPEMTDLVPTIELARMFEPVSDYFLTDTLFGDGLKNFEEHQPVKGFVGLTGKVCDWAIASKLVQLSGIPVILGGGISPDNVFDGIVKVYPAGVDSCTQTNALNKQGLPIRFKKDFTKVKKLVTEVRRAELLLE